MFWYLDPQGLMLNMTESIKDCSRACNPLSVLNMAQLSLILWTATKEPKLLGVQGSSNCSHNPNVYIIRAILLEGLVSGLNFKLQLWPDYGYPKPPSALPNSRHLVCKSLIQAVPGKRIYRRVTLCRVRLLAIIDNRAAWHALESYLDLQSARNNGHHPKMTAMVYLCGPLFWTLWRSR